MRTTDKGKNWGEPHVLNWKHYCTPKEPRNAMGIWPTITQEWWFCWGNQWAINRFCSSETLKRLPSAHVGDIRHMTAAYLQCGHVSSRHWTVYGTYWTHASPKMLILAWETGFVGFKLWWKHVGTWFSSQFPANCWPCLDRACWLCFCSMAKICKKHPPWKEGDAHIIIVDGMSSRTVFKVCKWSLHWSGCGSILCTLAVHIPWMTLVLLECSQLPFLWMDNIDPVRHIYLIIVPILVHVPFLLVFAPYYSPSAS